VTQPLEPTSRPYAAGQLDVLRLGRVPYEAAHALQQRLVQRRIAREVSDTLVLCEHDPVVTVGRSAVAPAVGDASIPVVQVERGGEATFHGPGQLVAYPILELPEGRRDLRRYLRDLEAVVIGALAEVEVTGERREGLTGVWVAGRKVCSIGVAVRRWVTWHGLALNLRADLGAFATFEPCGLDPAVMANVEEFTELPARTLLFEVLVVKHLCEVFGLELPPPPPPPPAPDPGPLPLYPGPGV
jgi:lipoate-protein ligase B